MLRKRVYDPARGGATDACPESFYATDKWCSCTTEFLLDNFEHGFTIDLPGTENECNIEIKRNYHDKFKECVEIALCALIPARRSGYAVSNGSGGGTGAGKSLAAFAVIYADNTSEKSMIARLTLDLKQRNEQGQKVARETVRKTKYLCPKAMFFGIEKLLIVVRQEYVNESGSEATFDEPEPDAEPFQIQPAVGDVILALGDARIQAHKFVLTSVSPVFTAMFRSQLLESQTNVIQIPPLCDLATLKTFLVCVYQPHVSFLDRETIADVFAALFEKQSPFFSSTQAFATNSDSVDVSGIQETKKRRIDELKEDGEQETVEEEAGEDDEEEREGEEDDPPWMSKKELKKSVAKGKQDEEEEEVNNTTLAGFDMQTVTSDILPLLKIAHYYQTTPLVRRIEQKMLKTLYPETLTLYYEAATMYQLDRLVRACATLVGDLLYQHCRWQSVSAPSDDAWHAKLLPFIAEFLRREYSPPSSSSSASAPTSPTQKKSIEQFE